MRKAVNMFLLVIPFCASIINVSFKDVVIPLRRRMAATTESR
jgi:hypothetical protein